MTGTQTLPRSEKRTRINIQNQNKKQQRWHEPAWECGRDEWIILVRERVFGAVLCWHACLCLQGAVCGFSHDTLVSSLSHILPLQKPFPPPLRVRHPPPPFTARSSLSLSRACLASSSSSRCRDVNFTADIFFYAGPRAQCLSRSHLPPRFQSKWLSFVGKISLHFKNPLKLSKIWLWYKIDT